MPMPNDVKTTARDRFLLRMLHCSNELQGVLEDARGQMPIEDEIKLRKALSVCDQQIERLTKPSDELRREGDSPSGMQEA